jgi:hypothetical protein
MDIVAPYNWPFPTYLGKPITSRERKPKGLVVVKQVKPALPSAPY